MCGRSLTFGRRFERFFHARPFDLETHVDEKPEIKKNKTNHLPYYNWQSQAKSIHLAPWSFSIGDWFVKSSICNNAATDLQLILAKNSSTVSWALPEHRELSAYIALQTTVNCQNKHRLRIQTPQSLIIEHLPVAKLFKLRRLHKATHWASLVALALPRLTNSWAKCLQCGYAKGSQIHARDFKSHICCNGTSTQQSVATWVIS